MKRIALAILMQFFIHLPVLHAQQKPADVPLYEPVPNFVAPKPGEHPRLFFRRDDIPALRARMNTPEGKAILSRLRKTLGNDGESMPTVFNTNDPVNKGAKGGDLPLGAFTNGHAAGFGFLYVLTGEKKYAELAKQCLVKMFDENASDRDERFTWSRPGAGLRVGMMLVQVSMAYDFCYDAWDAEFRSRVVKELVDYRRVCVSTGGWEGGTKGLTFARVVEPYYPPGSNHFGALVGGAGVALLAVNGDPEATALQPQIDKHFVTLEKNLKRAFTQGLGDGGFFAEGPGPFQMNTNTSLVPMIQAMRIAGGKDYAARPNGSMPTMKYAFELMRRADGVPVFPCRNPSTYGTEEIELDGSSHGGLFSQGFGAIPEAHKPALLWIWKQYVEPGEAQRFPRWMSEGERSFDVFTQPHRGVLSFINWPIGIEPKHPLDVVGTTTYRDSIHGYYAFRNRWSEGDASKDDAIVTFHFGGPRGFIKCPAGPILVWGLGARTTFPVKLGPTRALVYETRPADHSGFLSTPVRDGVCAVAIDYSGASGAPVLVAMTAPGLKPVERSEKQGDVFVQTQSVTTDAGATWILLTLSRKQIDKPVAEGDSIRLGEQTLSVETDRVKLAR